MILWLTYNQNEVFMSKIDVKKEIERASDYLKRLDDKVNKVDDYLDEHIDQAKSKVNKLQRLFEFIKSLFRG